MSLHTKLFVCLACLAMWATSSMVSIAVDPDMTPTYAVLLAPYAAIYLPGLAVVSYGLDLWTRYYGHD